MISVLGPKAIVGMLTVGALALGLPFSPTLQSTSDGPPHPANKTSIASSTMEVFGPATEVELLNTLIKTSKPTDLVISVTLECALWTEVTTVGNDVSEAMAAINVWIEFDGAPVLVSSDESGAEDAGQVVFCNRTYRVVTTQFDDEDATINQFLATRTANGFNWILLDAGSATHSIVVKAELETQATDDADAKAVVGKRTLVVEPMMLANDASL